MHGLDSDSWIQSPTLKHTGTGHPPCVSLCPPSSHWPRAPCPEQAPLQFPLSDALSQHHWYDSIALACVAHMRWSRCRHCTVTAVQELVMLLVALGVRGSTQGGEGGTLNAFTDVNLRYCTRYCTLFQVVHCTGCIDSLLTLPKKTLTIPRIEFFSRRATGNHFFLVNEFRIYLFDSLHKFTRSQKRAICKKNCWYYTEYTHRSSNLAVK